METLYKLTDQNNQSHGGCQWGKGVEHTALGLGELCTEGWLHAYRHPVLALLMNPAHAAIEKPRLWLAEGEVGKDDGTKVGCTSLRTIKRLRKPRITKRQRIRFAVLCAKAVLPIFESRYPDDARPRQSIAKAQEWLKAPTKSNVRAAYVAAFATYAAASVYAGTALDLVDLAHKAMEE